MKGVEALTEMTSDTIRFDLPNRRLDMVVGDAELATRRAAWIRARAALRARIGRDVLAAHFSGRSGLRLRFPAIRFRSILRQRAASSEKEKL
jgi:hypothetical protein